MNGPKNNEDSARRARAAMHVGGIADANSGLGAHLFTDNCLSLGLLNACNFAIGWKILHAQPRAYKNIPNKYNSFTWTLFGTILAGLLRGYSQ